MGGEKLFRVLDLAMINIATLLALWIHGSRTNEVFGIAYLERQLFWFGLFSILWIIFSEFGGVYQVGRPFLLSVRIPSILFSLFLVLISYLLIFFYFAPQNMLPRGIVLYQEAIGFILLSLWRIAFLSLGLQRVFARRVIIVGGGRAGNSIAQALEKYAKHQYRVVGFVDDQPQKTGSWIEFLSSATSFASPSDTESKAITIKHELLGLSKELTTIVKKYGVSEVILAITNKVSEDLFQSLLNCTELGVKITHMPVLYSQISGQIPIEHVGQNWYVALPLDSSGASRTGEMLKRLFDIVGAFVGLILIIPFFPLIALAIYVDSPGPIFYRQERVGKSGETFQLIKLRTMIPDAEKSGAVRAIERDSRITKVGRFLRKTRLDEMPQLVNVLLGDMSAVGPRPERPEHLEELEKNIPFHRLRHALKPGMAGWAVVNYGYIEGLEDAKTRLQYDLYYVKHHTILMDIQILLRMITQMVSLKGR